MPKKSSKGGSKRSQIDKKIMNQQKKQHQQARKKFGTPKCKNGEILREGYHRKKYSRSGSKNAHTNVKDTWVHPTCIESVTGRLHGEQLFRLEKNDLKPYGYENVRNKSVLQRHRALSRALNDVDALSLSRKLNALAVVNKNRDPSLSRAFKSDSEWVKTTQQYQNRPTSKNGSKRSSKGGSKK